MTLRNSIILGASLLFAPLYAANAAVVPFELTGPAGDGLLPGNAQPPNAAADSGSGGLGSIIYDTDSNLLFMDILWGSANGFEDLTGDANAMNLRGITADAPPVGWEQIVVSLYSLHLEAGFNSSATSGGFLGAILIDESDEAGLLADGMYITLQTTGQGGGQLRGHLQVVPVPAAVWLFGTGLLGLIGVARRKKA